MKINFSDSTSYYPSFDLGLATALVTLNYELVDIDRSNPRKVQFIFMRQKGIEENMNSYWSNQLQLSARSFFDNMKMLKNRIYDND